jgi:nicotinamide phosphoribosyltransferase
MIKNKFAPVAALFETDAYKLSHAHGGANGEGMYPAGTEYIYSNFTNRSSRLPDVKRVVAFGTQAFIQKHLMEAFEPFFAATEDEVAALYEERLAQILGPNNIGSEHIRALHRKGYLPLRFRTVKEGTLVPLQVPTLTVENTEPEFFWLTNYIETILSASIWHPSTVATLAARERELSEKWAETTGADKEFINWQWHDFSFRGQTSAESAAASGAGHLLSFWGTDNLNAFDFIDQYYDGDNGFVGGSVAATEHSVMCAGGQDNELETYQRLIRNFPTGILSVVSDTWDLFSLITEKLPLLHEDIMTRDGKLVIRPDSGDPVDILTGTVRELGKGTTPEEKGVIELLWEQFGGTVNDKGFKTLDSHIGAIYGDSITYERANEIFERMAAKGFASDNIVLGIGSFSYQYTTRDTVGGSAMKATWVQINGEGRDIMKDPKTAGHSKKSATGRLAVAKDETGELYLIQHATPEQEAVSELELVWEDGKFIRRQSFAEVREVLAAEKARVRALKA